MHSPTRLAYLLAYHCGALRCILLPPHSFSFSSTPSHLPFPGPVLRSPISLPFCTSVLPSPDRSSSCGGAGLGAPVIPPSRAGFPLRPRPLEGPGVSSPSGLPVTTCGAVSFPGWRGSFSSLPGLDGGGVCRYNGRRPKPRGSRGWYGSRGLTPPPYSVGCPWGASLGSGFGWISLDPWLRPCGLHYSAVSGVRGTALSLSLTRLTPMPFRLTPLPVDDVPGFPVHRRNCPT